MNYKTLPLVRTSACLSALTVFASLGAYPASSIALAQDTQALLEQAKGSGIELEYLSDNIKPGDDFYEYVNDKWLTDTQIPGDQSNYGAFTILDDEAKKDVRVLIEQAAESVNASGPVKQVGDFYSSFINTDERNLLGLEPISGLLEQVANITDKSAWIKVVAGLNRIGVSNPLGYYIEPDARKSDQYAAYVVQSGITMPDRDYYLDDAPRFQEARVALLAYITAVLDAAKLEDSETQAAAVLKFETQLASAQWTNTELRDPINTYNKMDVAAFADAHQNLHWLDYSQVVDLPVAGNIVIGQPSFFDSLDSLIEQTDLATLKAYTTLQIIDGFAEVLSEDLERLHFDFHRTALSGVGEQEPLWKRGVQTCNALLGMPVGQMYVEAHFPAQAKTEMVMLVENLKRAYEVRIDDLNWMGQGTKQRAIEKLNLITTKIGYPDKWKDYSSVEISRDDLVANILNITEFEHVYSLSKLGQPIDRKEWHMPPQTVNAYYSPLMNEIVFPAAILQPPFFNLMADDAVNYGAIGAVIGHEISHAFDDSGSKYDGQGNLRDWWTEQDRAEFENRAKTLVKQYSAYMPFDDAHLNGELTLGENIGDLGGMASAYTAYQISLNGKSAPLMDGLTGDQRFFMGWAQVWRRKYRELELRKRLLTDPHSPSRYRADGIVSNMDAFYKAFDIKPADKMFIAPEQRVRIW